MEKWKASFEKVPLPVQLFVGIAFAVSVFAGVSRLLVSHHTEYRKEFVDSINKVIRLVQDQQAFAIQMKDKDTVAAVQNINQAIGGLLALKAIVPESEIIRLTGINVPKLDKALAETQNLLNQYFVVEK
jgi:hypothetical protein